jgi:hypothetical protein
LVQDSDHHLHKGTWKKVPGSPIWDHFFWVRNPLRQNSSGYSVAAKSIGHNKTRPIQFDEFDDLAIQNGWVFHTTKTAGHHQGERHSQVAKAPTCLKHSL